MPKAARVDAFVEFFGRMWSIDLACPACGTLHIEKTQRRWHRKNVLRPAWDPLTSYFKCRECTALFVLGIVAWRPPVGGGHRWPPADHLPKPWHLAQMRELIGPGGFLLGKERLTTRQEVNLLIEPPCSCTVTEGLARRDPACPVHGRVPAPLAAKPDPRWGPKGIRYPTKPYKPKPRPSGT